MKMDMNKAEEPSKQERDNVKNRIIYLLVVIGSLFILLIVYLTYFKLTTSDRIVSNSYNRRNWEKENNIIRGSITDRNGVVVAKSVKKDGKNERVYPFNELYSHIVGYNSKAYGRTLLEATYNNYLLGNTGVGAAFNFTQNGQSDNTGDSLVLTIDNRLQQKAAALMEGKQGAVVAMNPATGEILAMVSKPDFNPNSSSLSENWQELAESDQHPFFPRATQGLYAPGSTFKIITTAAAIKAGLRDFTFKDSGAVTIDGKIFSNSGGKAHGTLDLKKAFAVSSNVFFAKLGVETGDDRIRGEAESMGMNRDIPFDISLKKSVFPSGGLGTSKADVAAEAIGQGKVLVTPLQMALITSCIANGGTIMEPMLVSQIVSPKGSVVKSFAAKEYSKALDKAVVQAIGEAMREAVVSGTGKRAAVSGIHVAGKTGTAQNEQTTEEKGSEHAWFTGYAPYENPRIAVTVILEYSGATGGEAAAPIAARLIKEYMSYASSKK